MSPSKSSSCGSREVQLPRLQGNSEMEESAGATLASSNTGSFARRSTERAREEGYNILMLLSTRFCTSDTQTTV